MKPISLNWTILIQVLNKMHLYILALIGFAVIVVVVAYIYNVFSYETDCQYI
jgi:hypothetical protein